MSEDWTSPVSADAGYSHQEKLSEHFEGAFPVGKAGDERNTQPWPRSAEKERLCREATAALELYFAGRFVREWHDLKGRSTIQQCFAPTL